MKRIIAPQGNILWEKIVNPRPLDPEDELYRSLVDFIFWAAEPDEDDSLT